MVYNNRINVLFNMWIQQYYVKQLQFEQWSDTSLNIVQYFLTFNNFDRGNAFKNLILISGLPSFVWIIYFNNLFLSCFFDSKDISLILVYHQLLFEAIESLSGNTADQPELNYREVLFYRIPTGNFSLRCLNRNMNLVVWWNVHVVYSLARKRNLAMHIYMYS